MGLLDYPVLQAADIVIYKASRVPIGKDQAAHLELSREIVRAFNRRYGPIFPEPQAVFTEAPVVLGIDGVRKMSKSAGNSIPIFAEPDEIRRLVMSMVTDRQRIKRTDPGRPEVCNVCRAAIGTSARTTSRSRTASGPRGPAASRPSSCSPSGISSASARCGSCVGGSLPTSSACWPPARRRCARSWRRRWPRSAPPPASTPPRPSPWPGLCRDQRPLGRRERRWLLAFLVLGSAYFAVLLTERLVLGFLGGFSQILLILFLAWLLAFVMSPVARFFENQVHLSRGIAVGVAVPVRPAGAGLRALHDRRGHHPAVRAGRQPIFRQTATKIEATLAGYQSTLGLDRFDIDLVPPLPKRPGPGRQPGR